MIQYIKDRYFWPRFYNEPEQQAGAILRRLNAENFMPIYTRRLDAGAASVDVTPN